MIVYIEFEISHLLNHFKIPVNTQSSKLCKSGFFFLYLHLLFIFFGYTINVYMSAQIIELQTRRTRMEQDDPKPSAKVQAMADFKLKIENGKWERDICILFCSQYSLNSMENSGVKSYFYDLI